MDTKQLYNVAGTSALKPDCSRYSNENERIIIFPGTASHEMPEADYEKIAHARHARTSDRMVARCTQVAQRSQVINDVTHGSVKGTPFGNTPTWKLAVAGSIYSLGAIIALFIAL